MAKHTETNSTWRTRRTTPSKPAAEALPALSTREAAALLGLTEVALGVMRKRGGGPAYLRYGRTIRYLQEDVLEYRTKHRVAMDD